MMEKLNSQEGLSMVERVISKRWTTAALVDQYQAKKVRKL